MTPEELKRIGDHACVSIAAGHDCMWAGDHLEPRLWEDLRAELQRRYRRSTGETMAVLTIENAPTPQPRAEVHDPVDIVAELREVAAIETSLLYSRRSMLKRAADEIDTLRKIVEGSAT